MEIKLRLNKDIKSPRGRIKKGSTVVLEVDSERQPLDFFWRRCLKEAQIDSCVEILVEQKNRKVKK